MAITLTEAINALTNGEAVTWQKSGTFKAGTIHLNLPGQRRIFEYLVSAGEDDVANADESLFEGLILAWKDEEADPALKETTTKEVTNSGPWRLDHIYAEGFGGLNTPGGPPFELKVGGENWCLEGYNGSGKTSLASLILWALTGYRNCEQDGPIKDNGQRETVTDGNKKIGTWPPLVTYPNKPIDLLSPATVYAVLTFTDPDGNETKISRRVTSPVEGDPVVIVEKDDKLILPAELIETGLLMPARIGHVGFGTKSQSLYDALKMLTGLDQLASIGLGAAGLCHGAKRFLKYAKNNGIEGLERSFKICLERSNELAGEDVFTISDTLQLGSETLIDDLNALEKDASERAASSLSILKTEIADDIDLTNSDKRDQLSRAVATARVYLSEGTKGIDLFSSWAALKQAGIAGFSDVQKEINSAKEALATALHWNEKRQADKKLQLKALASRYYTDEDLLGHEASCPLCETKLTSENQLTLGKELSGLKEDATVAERALSDACRDIQHQLRRCVPEGIIEYGEILKDMNPRQLFAEVINKRFSDGEPFVSVLTGIAAFSKKYADKITDDLPDFSPKVVVVAQSEINDVVITQEYIAKIERLSALTAWWVVHRGDFLAGWKNLIGVKSVEGEFPRDSLEGKLRTLESAMEESGPLDKIAKQVAASKTYATSWNEINSIQKTREAIATAVEPLKALIHLVDSETHRTVVTLKDRVAVILDEIRLKDRLSFVETAMAKKTVTVEAQFAEGMQIDAALVANSSWLRALLWAFIFALREQAIDEAKENIFPLMVLDDPQTTFDPKNKRKWASKIANIANFGTTNSQGMQLFLTTHEHEFASIMSVTCELAGQQGKMAGPTKSSKVAHVVNGTFLERQFAKASADEDDEEGYKYIQQVRVYCEDLLKIMLRPESFELSGDTLGKLIELLKKLNKDKVAPYDRNTFAKLLNYLNESSQPIIKVINATHHTYDGTIGYAQAVDVEKYWKQNLQRGFVHAFRRAADYDAYGGVSHLFPEYDNVIDFPAGYKDKVKAISFKSTGIAAAAESDGLVGSGLIEIEEWEKTEPVVLFNHSAYRLNAGTLDPVAGIGDVILVQDFGDPRERNLTVTSIGEKLYARRLNKPEDDEEMAVLTAQATDPYALHVPVIVPRASINPRKIVGTLFLPKSVYEVAKDNQELCRVEDFSIIESRLKGVNLFKVKGRSMEPIALEDQYVMTVKVEVSASSIASLNGELVIAIDEDAAVYFKRLRVHGDLVVLESANSSASTSSEILSLQDGAKHKKLTNIRSVVGVLFDLPTVS